jgi:pseudaminic acid cytidylyltransferase
MNIAIILARGGSKRIPEKNIKDFLGMPIINYPIRTALSCNKVFDKVIVTTDSEHIAKIAKKAGAEVPFMRPAELADDFTVTADVVVHAISETEQIYGEKIVNVCCFYATSSFLRAADICRGFELLTTRKVSSVFSVTTFPFPILRAQKINKNGNLEMFWPEYELARSNDLPEAYHDAGQFYWLDAQKFLQEKRMYGKDALPVILPRGLVHDIDTFEDWDTAELLYTACEKQGLL